MSGKTPRFRVTPTNWTRFANIPLLSVNHAVLTQCLTAGVQRDIVLYKSTLLGSAFRFGIVPKMRVTFDSQVLGKVAFPERRKKDPDHAGLEKISAALQEGRLQGFICESIGTLEAIENATRAEYFASRIPKSDVQISADGTNTFVNITIKTDHDRHPGLHVRLADKLQRAQTLGMRLLYVPSLNVQLPKQFLNDRAFYESRLFETQSYADRFWEIAAAIETRGVGSATINAITKRFQDRLPVGTTASLSGMRLLVYAKDEAERTSIARAIGEWADGDLVASHLASGNDLLCTEDRGKSAGGPSIFDDANRIWLNATYGVNIVGVRELAGQIAS
jgi:hypothetical protein